jgi:hypothetical protein
MKKLLYIACLVFSAIAVIANEYYVPPRVKLIHDGWGFQYQGLGPNQKPSRQFQMTTSYIKNNIAMMEKNIPGNGIIIRFVTPANKCEGQAVNINAIFGGRKIKYEYFKDDIANLKSTKFKKFTDNFIGLTVSPGNVDWFDDKAWEAVCHNHSVVARIAKECGMVGMKFDIEEYHKNTMWQFNPAKGKTLAETHKKVRQRGQEFGKALFKEFPNMQMLCYWWFSLTRHKNDQYRPNEAEYMVAPFVNGVYDVLPPTVKIHDGNESCAYRANNEVEFYHLGIDIRKNFIRFLDPKHFAKYRAQTFLAPGLYVDPHFAPKFNFWNNQLLPDLETLGGVQLFKRNLINAMEVADFYVWMWHERYVWFPSHHPAKPIVISKVAPKVTEDLDLIVSPMPKAAQIVKAKKLPNLVKNGTFDKLPTKTQPVANFGSWFNGKGKFQRKVINGNPVAAAIGVVNGCIYQSHKVKPGEMYLVRCSAGNLKPGSLTKAAFTVNWKKNFIRQGKPFDDRFADYSKRSHFFRRLGNKMETVEFTVTVPETATHLEVMLSVNKASEKEEIYFDNVELYKVMD